MLGDGLEKRRDARAVETEAENFLFRHTFLGEPRVQAVVGGRNLTAGRDGQSGGEFPAF